MNKLYDFKVSCIKTLYSLICVTLFKKGQGYTSSSLETKKFDISSFISIL